MSNYYRGKRTRNIYDPTSTTPFKISRGKLDLFLNCPRCFYVDRRLGVGHPPGYPFNLNSAVDALLKKEFDQYRTSQTPHPIFLEHNLDLVPLDHPDIAQWRDSLHAGVQFYIPGTNLLLTGGVDDVWINPTTQELFIADYKATSKSGAVSLDAEWQITYKRQVEVYQWLFRKNGFAVSDTAFFVYCNGKQDRDRFDKQLHFDVSLLPYKGNANWVDGAISDAHRCLVGGTTPPQSKNCDFCKYVAALSEVVSE